jgi:predicted dehydrogenase
MGCMGRVHLSCYRRLQDEGAPVRLVAVCDIDDGRREGRDIATGNIGAGNIVDLSRYALYDDYGEMMAREQLDCLDIALPTHLHAEVAVAALEAGLHVISEKPMARTEEQCARMIDAARRSGKTLMTAQCLRFWPAYEYLKSCVESERFGRTISAYFFRGGGRPTWSWNNWILNAGMSGGCLLDQHIHDVDMVQWLFGMPTAVSSSGRNVVPGSGYDAVSTRYRFPDGKIVCAEDDWTINGGYGFEMQYRVNFEHGSVHFNHGAVKEYPESGDGFEPELPKDDGYYREIRYFIECAQENKQPSRCMPESTCETIRLAQAEQRSADGNGMWVLTGN